jgi:ketopantoate reductase
MATQQRILVIGGGALGVLAALNLEASLGVSVSLVLRSNFDVVSKHGYDIKSCDHGELRNWRPAEGW